MDEVLVSESETAPGLVAGSTGPVPLAFVICSGRSGSTLLRRLIGLHPDIACPPETNLVALCERMRFSASVLSGETAAGRSLPEGEGSLRSELAVPLIRQAVMQMVGQYLSDADKSVFCDKSLPNAEGARLLLEIFPNARFICLYRHCMDVIASILDASPFGLVAFGIEPFVSHQHYNYVLGLAEYWLAKAQMSLDLEKDYPEQCIRVKYEDLVMKPEDETERLFEFLGVSSGGSEMDFDNLTSGVPWGDGPGDHKIGFTREVELGSIGRGRSVPVDLLHEGILNRLNIAMKAMDYDPIDQSWNHQPMPYLKDVVPAWLAREYLLNVLRNGKGDISGSDGDTVRVALEDAGLTLLVTSRREAMELVDGCSDADLIARVDPILRIALGQLNFGQALRNGLIRSVSSEKTVDPPRAQFETLFERISP